MKKAGTILIYNCNGPEFSKMRQIFAMLRLLMRPVTPDKYDIPLIELAKGVGTPNPESTEPFKENMLVFCGMNPVLLRQVREVLRLAQLPTIHFSAVLTEQNFAWTSHQLRDDMEKNRGVISKYFQCPSDSGNFFSGGLLWLSYMTVMPSRGQHDSIIAANSFRSYRTLVGRDPGDAVITYDHTAKTATWVNTGGKSANHPNAVNALYLGGHVLNQQRTRTDPNTGTTLKDAGDCIVASRALDEFSQDFIK